MKICQKHWKEMIEAIKTKGMWHLVSKNSEELKENINKKEKGEPTKYDPLFAANNMITFAAIQDAGIMIMGADDKGNQYCPLCECDKQETGLASNWINGCTDDCQIYCQTMGLLSVN